MPWWCYLIIAFVLFYLYVYLCGENANGETRLQGTALTVAKSLFKIIAFAPLVLCFIVEDGGGIVTLYVIIGAVVALCRFPKVDYGITALYTLILTLSSLAKWYENRTLDNMTEFALIVTIAGFILAAVPKQK